MKEVLSNKRGGIGLGGKGKVSGEVNNERALKREGVIRDMKKSLIRN